MMKVVINNCHGGFGLSEAAYNEMGLEWDGYGYGQDIKRNDPRLVECVEKLGADASGLFAHLKVVEIPDGIEFGIEEYYGIEWVSENHRTWR